jgi:hypothetical protein
MRKMFLTVVAGFLLGVGLYAQGPGSLSNQVLQLLTRGNSWTGTNSFLDLRLILGTPSDTALRLYSDAVGNLYFNGNLVAGATGGGTPHNLLSSTHPDTLIGAVARGSLVVGNATPKWAALGVCAAGAYIGSNGTDTGCQTSAASFTAIPAGQITGTASAFNGAAITSLSAANLLGTVPLASLVGITTSQLSASAAITRSQLSIPAGITLTTDVTGILPFANGGTTLSTAAANTTLVSSGSAWVATAVPNCVSGTTALAFTTATGLFSCQTLSVGAGTVTSVAMTVPTGFAVGGTPITSTGTLALTLSNENANLVWAGPGSGGAAAPTFRALVNADLPATAVTPGTYPLVTVNQQGVITAGTATVALGTYATGTLARANGGTGVTVSANNTVLLGTGTVWAPATIPDCQGGTLGFVQSTNLFACVTAVATSGTYSAGTAPAGMATGDVSAAESATTATYWLGSDANGFLFRNGLTLQLTAGAGSSLKLGANITDSGSVPTITSGFGTSPTIAGRDYAFLITLGSAAGNTGGVVAFNAATAYTNAPVCEASAPAVGAPSVVTTTTTALTLVWSTGTYTGIPIHVLCRGY